MVKKVVWFAGNAVGLVLLVGVAIADEVSTRKRIREGKNLLV